MKLGIPVMLICALGYGSAVMADCGEEDVVSSAAEGAAPAGAHTGMPKAAASQVQEAKTQSAGANLSTVPAQRNFLDTPYEDGGYNP